VRRVLLAAAALLAFGVTAAPGADDQQQKLIPVKLEVAGFTMPASIVADSIQVLFDPPGANAKATPWKHHDIQGLDAPTLEFTSGEPYRLQFELFFDRYEEGKTVREYTDRLEKLAIGQTGPGDVHRPPTVLLTWGTGLAFKCVLESFSLRYTLFLDDGTPVRAVMNTVWKEFSPAQDQLKGNPRH
jgi:hypothetical protein